LKCLSYIEINVLFFDAKEKNQKKGTLQLDPPAADFPRADAFRGRRQQLAPFLTYVRG
jgi:hypothetical protein